jgi:hypothetical protein
MLAEMLNALLLNIFFPFSYLSFLSTHLRLPSTCKSVIPDSNINCIVKKSKRSFFIGGRMGLGPPGQEERQEGAVEGARRRP